MLSFNSGPYYENDDIQIRLPATADIIYYASDLYAQYFGVAPTVLWRHSSEIFSKLTAAAQAREYETDHDKDGSYFALSLSPRYFWHGGAYMVQATLGYFWEETESDIYTNRGPALSLGWLAGLTDKLSVYTEAGYQNPRYEEEDDYYGETQKDDQYRGIVSLSYLLPWWDLTAISMGLGAKPFRRPDKGSAPKGDHAPAGWTQQAMGLPTELGNVVELRGYEAYNLLI